MFKDIEINENDWSVLSLFGTHDITVRRENGDNAEIVIHPCYSGKLSVRYAKEPYCCKLCIRHGKFGEEDYKLRWEDCDLSVSEDWGEIDTTDPQNPKYGNDEDGYDEIIAVELPDGYPHGTSIPLDVFSRDVDDFTVHHIG